MFCQPGSQGAQVATYLSTIATFLAFSPRACAARAAQEGARSRKFRPHGSLGRALDARRLRGRADTRYFEARQPAGKLLLVSQSHKFGRLSFPGELQHTEGNTSLKTTTAHQISGNNKQIVYKTIACCFKVRQKYYHVSR